MNLRAAKSHVRHIQSTRKTCLLGIGTFLLLLGSTRSHAFSAQDDATISDFESRVTKYLELRKKEAGSAPRPTNSLEKIDENKQDIAAKVKTLRSDAKQGDIFTPEITMYFRHKISETLAGPDGRKIRASLRRAEPVHGVSLHVNESYPEGMPLQSTPPTLLQNLPKLPKELEYRIVGNNLVLHDITPNIIVDFVAEAIPSAKE
jgi:hypothetical protein